MSKPAKPGGYVQISGKRYRVVAIELRPEGEWRHIVVERDGLQYSARSEIWRAGCGPWKLSQNK